MTKRNSAPGPGQEAMFIQGSVSQKLEMPIDVSALQPAEQVSTPDGQEQFPAVDLAERAASLDLALKALGKHSQRTGFQMAAADSSPFRRGIERHYQDATDRVVEGASNTKSKLITEAKKHFAKAAGMETMIASGMQTEEEAKASTREDFDKFTQRYADSRNRPARDGMRKRMQSTQREQAKLRRRVS